MSFFKSKTGVIVLVICGLVGAIAFWMYIQNKPQRLINAAPIFNKNPLLKNRDRGVATSASRANRSPRRKNIVLVKLKTDATEAQKSALETVYAQYGLRLDKKLLNGKISRLKVNNKSFEDREEEIVQEILNTGAVEFAEPDFAVPPSLLPSDSLYYMQWHHKKLGSETAWNSTQGSASVIVAVCDAGFDLAHPDLAQRFLLPGYNTVTDNDVIINSHDHGTKTSGALAATGNNSIGVAGMAWQIKILPIQISTTTDGASTYSDIAECISHAIARGAKIASISYDYLYTSATVNEAAIIAKTAGSLVVAAAGNGGVDISSWGESPNLIVVGATDYDDNLAYFSNWGTPVDLVAPGLDIYSTLPNNNYYVVSGTSYSTPLVAGTLALLFSVNPTLTISQAESYLLSSLTTTAGNLKRLNTAGALQLAAPPPPPPPPPAVPPPIIVDNLKVNLSDTYHISKGKWCTSTATGSYGATSLTTCGSTVDSYRLIPKIPAQKKYAVYIRYLSASTRSTRVPVKVNGYYGITTKYITQRTGGKTWVSLGTYTLKAGTGNYVELSDANGQANIDAVKFQEL